MINIYSPNSPNCPWNLLRKKILVLLKTLVSGAMREMLLGRCGQRTWPGAFDAVHPGKWRLSCFDMVGFVAWNNCIKLQETTICTCLLPFFTITHRVFQ